MPRVLASADIGSNTVHLLVAEANGTLISRVGDTNEWISLGEIVGREGKIPSALCDRLIKILADFRKVAIGYGAEGMYVFATEAMRKASNRKQVLDAIRIATGLAVDLIPGPREAELGLRGAWLDCEGPGPFILCEVGGGSAQIARCLVDQRIPWIDRESSLPLGTGTLIAQLGLTCPCTDESYQALVETIRGNLAGAGPLHCERIVCCGGVARGLWRALHPDGEREIARQELDYLIWVAKRLTLDVLIDRFAVKPKRAATLLPGAALYRQLLDEAGHDRLLISRFGVREGAILEMAEDKIEPCRL